MSNSDFLHGRRHRGAARPPRPGEEPLVRELGRDPLVAQFEQGPFPAAPVPPWPPAVQALVERMTGRRFDPAVFAAYERIRAFVDYPGITVTPAMAQLTRREDPAREHRAPATVAPAAPGRPAPPVGAPGPASTTAPATGLAMREAVDPRDLGD